MTVELLTLMWQMTFLTIKKQIPMLIQITNLTEMWKTTSRTGLFEFIRKRYQENVSGWIAELDVVNCLLGMKLSTSDMM